MHFVCIFFTLLIFHAQNCPTLQEKTMRFSPNSQTRTSGNAGAATIGVLLLCAPPSRELSRPLSHPTEILTNLSCCTLDPNVAAQNPLMIMTMKMLITKSTIVALFSDCSPIPEPIATGAK